MTKPKKPTFKKQPKATGLAAIGHGNAWVDIKFEGKKVGQIIPESWSRSGFQPGIMVKKTAPDSNPNCDWTWVHFKVQGTEQEAREFILRNWDVLVEKYQIHSEED